MARSVNEARAFDIYCQLAARDAERFARLNALPDGGKAAAEHARLCAQAAFRLADAFMTVAHQVAAEKAEEPEK